MKTFNSGKHSTQNYELQPVPLFFFFFSFCIFLLLFYFIASKTHTEKKKQQKLHRINKEIKRKKLKQKKQTNSEFTHMAIYLQYYLLYLV